jgi:hypothetical protein
MLCIPSSIKNGNLHCIEENPWNDPSIVVRKFLYSVLVYVRFPAIEPMTVINAELCYMFSTVVVRATV